MEIRWQEGFRFRFIFLLLLPVYCTVLDSDKPLSRNGNQVARGLPVPVYFPPSLPVCCTVLEGFRFRFIFLPLSLQTVLFERALPVPVYFPPSSPCILYCSRHVCLHMALCCSSVRLVNISGGRYFPVLVYRYYSVDFVNNAFSVK